MQETDTTPASTPAFQLGDQVSYIVVNETRNGCRISAREGKIVGLDHEVALVQSRNGRRSIQPFAKLTPKGQRNALTRALLGE